ncbi:MAG: pyridine nucleotide-disulfide oxidoreductase/dicluster-binding protein [Pelotomaculum sp.]|jgi:Fe-S oxidoreductase
MKLDDFRYWESLCTRDEPVFCTNQCPLGVDVKNMVARLLSGNFTGAYKSYSNQVLFPGIVSRICDEPCKTACIRRNIDEAISVKLLEKACCDFTTSTEVSSFYMPPKNKRVAVVGGGLGGLSCAVKLVQKGYDVCLYEGKDRLGGCLWATDSNIQAEVLAEELNRITRNYAIKLHLNSRISSLSEIEFDALYIATGRGGETFGLLDGFDPLSLATAKNGVFMSSKTAGRKQSSVLIPIREGVTVAQSIDSFLKTGKMGGAAGHHEVTPSRLSVDISGAERQAAVKPAEPAGYTAAEAVEEAKRCLRCECNACYAACELISYYKKTPKKIIEDVNASLNVVKAITKRVASRQLNSCNLCGLCKEVCPNSLDFEEIFLASRRELHRGGHLPLAFHDFWMRDMEFSNSEDVFLALDPSGESKSRYLFFPGCQLGASDPGYVTATYDYLLKRLEGGVSIMVGCCGAPAEWAGREKEHASVMAQIKENWQDLGCPVVILACPTCKKMFTQYLPGIKVISLWNVIAEQGLTGSKRTGEGQRVTVFDSCASRHDPEVRHSIRTILKNSGYQLEELPYSGERAQCCGYGGQIHAVNMPLLELIVSNRVQGTPYDYITYCTNCRDTFASAKKPAVHMLDLMFHEDIKARAARKPPSLTQRRLNRIQLKKQLLEQYGGKEMESPARDYASIKVFISPELMEKMDRNLIIAEDAQRTIHYCETTGNKIKDLTTGNLIGHLQNEVITFWVVYRPEGDGFRLVSIYSHRMSIEEDVK